MQGHRPRVFSSGPSNARGSPLARLSALRHDRSGSSEGTSEGAPMETADGRSRQAAPYTAIREAPVILAKEVKLGRRLGGGAFGEVFEGTVRSCRVAVKVPKAQFSGMAPEQEARFKEEVKVMSRLFHPHIALFMGAVIESDQVMIVTELLDCDLQQLVLESNKEISLFTRVKWLRQAAEGMAWLHGANVIHMDFKTSNLLFETKQGRVKVCDFGLSTFLAPGEQQQRKGRVGTLLYMAPEVLQGKPFNHAADVHSFGITASEIVMRKKAYSEVKWDSVADLQDIITLQDGRPRLSSSEIKCPKSLTRLITASWAADPHKRPSFASLVKHWPRPQIDSAVLDRKGRRFWRTNFVHDDNVLEEIPWRDFYPVFINEFGHPIQDREGSVRWECLREVMCYDSEMVSIKRFGAILGFLGPLDVTFSERLELMMRQPWFWGDTTKDRADDVLTSAPTGSWLIRFSSTHGNFTISFSDERNIWHRRIVHSQAATKADPNLFSVVDDQWHKSLADLVSTLRRNPNGLDIGPLGPPVTDGRPYERIFRQRGRRAVQGYMGGGPASGYARSARPARDPYA